MAIARRLAKDSHTTNVPVTVWILKDFASRALGSYLVQVLKDLGYRAHQRTVPGWRFFPAVSNSHSKIQAGLNAWGADYPTASEFFLPLLSCRSYYQDPNPSNTSNYAGFCDPHADQLASQAQAAQLTDPATARRLWAPGGSHRHRPGTMGPDPQLWRHHIRLRPDRELPGVPHLRAPV
jgi:peptide/nickel transport system substrate-binding protein